MLDWLLSHSPLLYFTQSLWRDEAFSILAAERPISWIIHNLSFEPPVYYVLLHFWMKLFGQSEIAVRSLSLLGFGLTTVVVIHWSEKLFRRHWLSWFIPLFFFLNPMLIYYAFEIRTYGWYMLFATLSMYAYIEKQWKLLIIANVLGFYTHTYMLIVPFSQFLHWLIIHRSKLKINTLGKDSTIVSLFINGLLISPWIVKVILGSSMLKQSWYFPVDLNLVTSVLGNMFLGYEGTPWYLWTYTKVLSLLLLFLFFIALSDKRNIFRNSYLFIATVAPLVLVIGISFLKPLFVNRYLIPVTVSEVMLIGFAIWAIRNVVMQKVFAGALLVFVLLFNLWYPPQHSKLDIRKTLTEINVLKATNDGILVNTPLLFFETIYYAKDKNHVFLFNPGGGAFPWYVGGSIFSQSQMVGSLPQYPHRAFLIGNDGTYTVVYNRAYMAKLTSTKFH